MSDPGIMPVVELSPEEVDEQQQVINACNTILRKAAKKVYGHSTPLFVRELRDQYRKDPKSLGKLGKKIRSPLEEMHSREETIIAAYIRMAKELCTSFHITYRHSLPGLDLAEYMAVARCAIWEAMYSYTGSNKLSTYVYHCIKNALISMCRKESTKEKLSETIRNRYWDFFRDPNAEEEAEEHPLDLRKAIEQAGLTKTERQVIDVFLINGKKFGVINERTGRYYTRPAMNKFFNDACTKIRTVLEAA